MTGRRRLIAAVALAGALAATGAAYLANNTVTASGAGEGNGPVTITTTGNNVTSITTPTFLAP